MTKGIQSAETKNTIIYSIHSQKGGVGKTSIAIAIAGLEAIINNKKVLIIDADLTGTSIKDVLKWKEKKNEYNYVNELILGAPERFGKLTDITKRVSGMNSFYHQSEIDNNIYFIPSSRDYDDISKIIPLISQEDYLHYLRNRFEDILAAAITDNFDVVILDLPPGFYGLSKTICNMIFGHIKRRFEDKKSDDFTRLERLVGSNKGNSSKIINGRAVFVSTSDSVDYNALFPIFCQYIKREKPQGFPSWKNSDEKKKLPYSKLDGYVHFVFNKVGPLEDGGETDPPLILEAILNELGGDSDNKSKDGGSKESKENSETELNKKIELEDLVKFMDERLEKVEGVTCNMVAHFNMKNILLTIKMMQKKTQSDQTDTLSLISTGAMSEWCESVKNTLDIKQL